MSAVLKALAQAFVFLVELVVDIICVALFVAATVAVWRVPFWGWEFEWGDRTKFRIAALCCFGSSLLDLVSLPLGAAVLCSWRSLAFIAALRHYVGKGKPKSDEYFIELRAAAVGNFFLLLYDVPFLIMLAVIHAAVWRIPLFWMDVAGIARKENAILFGRLGSGRPSDDIHQSGHRKNIFTHFLHAAFELLCLPIILLLLVTGYRMPNVLAIMRRESSGGARDAANRKVDVFLEFLFIFADAPFALMALLLLPLPYRIKYIADDFAGTPTARQRRVVVSTHFAMGLLDVLAWAGALPVLLSVYRGFFLVQGVASKIAPWAPPSPLVDVTKASLSAPVGRTTGLVLTVEGSRPDGLPAAVVGKETAVKVYVRNGDAFWKAVGSAHGAAAASLGPAMLPVDVTKYLSIDGFRSVDPTGRCVFDLDVAQKSASIEKAMAKMAGSRVQLQIECGAHEHTLAAVEVQIGSSLDACVVAPVALRGNVAGERFGDVFAKSVAMQFALLLLDVVALAGLILLHVVPPRVYRVYTSCCEPKERERLRKQISRVDETLAVVEHTGRATKRALRDIDRELRGASQKHFKDEEHRRANPPRSSWARQVNRSGHDEDPDVLPPPPPVAIVSNHSLRRDVAEPLQRLKAWHDDNASPDAAACVDRFLDKLEGSLRRYARGVEHACGRYHIADLRERELHDASDGAYRAPALNSDNDARADAASLDAAAEAHAAPVSAEDLIAANDMAAEAACSTLISVRSALDADYRAQPWCGGKEGWGGVRATVFREVKETLFDLLAVVCALFIVGTLYRVFPLVASVVGKRRDEDLRTKCVQQVVQVGVDLVYLLKSLLVIAGVRGAFKLPVDVATYVCAAPSFAVARQVVDHHFVLLLSDLVYLLSLVLAWDAIRLTLATVVFGAFAPGVLLESALVKWSGMNDGADVAGGYGHNARAAAPAAARHHRGQMSVESKDTCRAGMILLVAIGWMYGLPVFAGYYVGRSEGAPGAAAGLYFGVMAALVSLSIVVAFVYREPRVCELRRPVVRSVRPTLVNVLAYGSVALEGALLLAAAVWAVEPGREVASAGSDVRSAGLGVGDAARYAFGVFGQSWDGTSGLPVGAYASVAVMLLHFVLAAMPVVTGHMLHWRKGSRLTQSVAWVCALQVLGQYVLLAVTRNVAEVLKCTPDDASGAVVVASMGRTECYEGRHLHMAVLMMVLLTYYLPSSSMRNSTVDESACAALDVAYAQLYRLLTNAGGALGVVASGFLWEHPAVAAGCVAFAGVWGLGWTLGYPALANAAEGEVCTVRAVRVYRGAMYGAVAVGSAVLAGARGSGATGAWPLYACLGVVAAAWAAAAVGNHVASRGWAMEGAEECREVLLEAERELGGGRMLGPGWAVVRPRWVREVRGAARASTLAMAALVLEKHVFVGKLPRMFFASRGTWVRDTTRLVAECDRAAFIDVDEELGGERWEYLIVCCACDCCSHRRTDSDDSDDDVRDEEADVEEALRSATVLRNVSRSDQTRQPLAFDGFPIEVNPPIADQSPWVSTEEHEPMLTREMSL